MKSVLALLVWLFSLATAPAWAGFIITIDNLTDYQSLSAFGNTNVTTNPIASSGAVGGFRTLSLNSLAPNSDSRSRLSIDPSGPHLSLSSDADVTATYFSFKWAGADGNGFSAQDFTTPAGMNSQVKFGLHGSDLAGSITWSFTDNNKLVSSYTANIPVHSKGSGSIPYAISLNSFSNPTGFNWTQIRAVELWGGGIPEWDFTIDGIVVVGVPEPGSAGLLLISLVLASVHIRRRKAA